MLAGSPLLDAFIPRPDIVLIDRFKERTDGLGAESASSVFGFALKRRNVMVSFHSAIKFQAILAKFH